MSTKIIKYKQSVWSLGKEFLSMKRKYTPLHKADEEIAEGKVVVITGANSGIGEVVALEMAKRNARVVMCCRDVEKAKKVMQKILKQAPTATLDIIALDLGNLASVRKCANEIREKYDHINILINNAGILFNEEKLHRTEDGFEMHMGVNHLGNFLFTMLLVDLLKPKQIENVSPELTNRIVFVGSTGHLFAELDLNDLNLEKRGKSFGMNNNGPYANSKLANMYFARELSKRLDGSGVNVSVLCPGFIKTDIFRNSGIIHKIKTNVGIFLYGSSMETGADVVLYCSLSTRIANQSGEMYRFNNVWPGVMDVLDDLAAKELWEKSEILVGLRS